MSDNSNARSGGISVAGLLGVVFVTLKLTGHIDWSWWWVTCPFWGPLALVLSIWAVFAFFALLISMYTDIRDRNRRGW